MNNRLSRPREGAKAVTWDWELIQSTFDETARCYTLTDQQIAFLLPVIIQGSWSTRWFNRPNDFETVEAWVADVANALMNPTDCGDVIITKKVTVENIINHYCTLIEQGEEPMSNMWLKDATDGTRLLVDCGCGQIREFILTELISDPTTGFSGSGIDTIPPQTLTFPDLSDPTTCYFSAAGQIIEDKIKGYVSAVGNYILTGSLQVILGAEMEAAQWVVDFLQGKWSLNPASLGFTVDDILQKIDEVDLAGYFSNYLEQRNLTGTINRWNLPFSGNFLPPSWLLPVPLTPYVVSWSNLCNLQSLNDALATAAYQCETGNSIPSDPTSDWEWRYTWNFLLNSAGTPDAMGGWVAASPTLANYVSGLGWAHAPAASNDFMTSIIHLSWNRAVTAVRIVLDAGMGGNDNRAQLGADGSLVYTLQPVTTPVIDLVFSVTPTTSLQATVNEFSDAGDNSDTMTKYIQRIDVYGTGTVPPDGTPF